MKKHLLIIWTIFVFLLLTMPMPINTNNVIEEGHLDKVAHFFMFGIFSYLIIYAHKNITNATLAIGFLAGVLYATFGEFIQSFLPTRSVSIYDFYAGVIGSLFFVIYYYVRNRKA